MPFQTSFRRFRLWPTVLVCAIALMVFYIIMRSNLPTLLWASDTRLDDILGDTKVIEEPKKYEVGWPIVHFSNDEYLNDLSKLHKNKARWTHHLNRIFYRGSKGSGGWRSEDSFLGFVIAHASWVVPVYLAIILAIVVIITDFSVTTFALAQSRFAILTKKKIRELEQSGRKFWQLRQLKQRCGQWIPHLKVGNQVDGPALDGESIFLSRQALSSHTDSPSSEWVEDPSRLARSGEPDNDSAYGFGSTIEHGSWASFGERDADSIQAPPPGSDEKKLYSHIHIGGDGPSETTSILHSKSTPIFCTSALNYHTATHSTSSDSGQLYCEPLFAKEASTCSDDVTSPESPSFKRSTGKSKSKSKIVKCSSVPSTSRVSVPTERERCHSLTSPLASTSQRSLLKGGLRIPPGTVVFPNIETQNGDGFDIMVWMEEGRIEWRRKMSIPN